MRPNETMTLNISAREMLVLDELANHHGMSKTGVMRQALRIYQLIHIRLLAGETLHFSGDQSRLILFAAVGLGEA